MRALVYRLREIAVGERYASARKQAKETFVQLLRRPMGTAGIAIIAVFTFLGVLAPLLAGDYPNYATGANLGTPNLPPGGDFPLGTDRFGRSLYALLLYGARVSLVVGLTSSLIAVVVGAAVGILSGYYGGGWDQLLSRLTDFFLVIPWLPFVLVLVAVLGPGFATVVIAIAIVSWPTTARVVRSKVLSVKTRAFIERARAVGAGDGHIMFRHIFPVVGPLIFANMILTVSTSIFTESFLAFFGLGDQTQVSWGTMIENAYDAATIYTGAYWYFLPPGICITALVLAFTMVSHALEEILNPKLRKR
jgi:peptide/nickel transport system permease protein